PPSFRPAALAGGIEQNGVLTTRTRWPDAGCAWAWTVPDALFDLSPHIRNAAHRGRYFAKISKDLAAAMSERAITGDVPRADYLVVQSTRHPRAPLPWRPPADGLHRHVVIGDTPASRGAYALFILARYM